MKILWMVLPSSIKGQIPLVGQNRWLKYMSSRTNFIYPITAAYGCTMLRDAGFEINFLDALAEEKDLPYCINEASKYDLVITEGRTAIMPWVWHVIREIHKVTPNTKVALYGDHVMCRPSESLWEGADYIINCGDYGYGSLKLALKLRDNGVAQANFVHPNMKDIGILPFMDRELVNWHNYYETWRHRPAFGWVQSQIGCGNKCTYCSWTNTFYNHTVRVFTPERAVAEMVYANSKYGITEFLDDSDTFYKVWASKFTSLLKEENLDVLWNIQTRADQIPEVPALKQMKRIGLRIVKLGIDAGNDNSLLRIRKGHTLLQAETAIKRLREAGLEVHVNMIVGYPWETKKEAYGTINWVIKQRPNQAQFSIIQPYIGTPLYDESIKNNWFAIDPNDYESWNVKTPILQGVMNTEEIVKLYRDSWEKFYYNPRYVGHQILHSINNCIKERNLDSLRHLWRGYKAVSEGHAKAME